jgi:hypothetical protein
MGTHFCGRGKKSGFFSIGPKSQTSDWQLESLFRFFVGNASVSIYFDSSSAVDHQKEGFLM